MLNIIAKNEGLEINGHLFNAKVPLSEYCAILGQPTRTIDAGPPAPVGHRNNQVHLYDLLGIYLTEHHHSRLIESVNVVFDTNGSPFPIQRPFSGLVKVEDHEVSELVPETALAQNDFVKQLPGEYQKRLANCWIGVSAIGHTDSRGKRRSPRYIASISICPRKREPGP